MTNASAHVAASPSLPLQSDPEFQRLHPRVTTVWRLSAAITVAIWGALGVAAIVVLPNSIRQVPVAAIIWTLLALLVGWGVVSVLFYTPARWRAWTFHVGDADVRLRHGVFWRKESVVPHVRIQHVDTTHGPIERALGLASVTIFTAGSVHGVLTIPGLALAEAEELRDRLAALSGTDDAV